jgi:hypothetical protein
VAIKRREGKGKKDTKVEIKLVRKYIKSVTTMAHLQ